MCLADFELSQLSGTFGGERHDLSFDNSRSFVYTCASLNSCLYIVHDEDGVKIFHPQIGPFSSYRPTTPKRRQDSVSIRITTC